MSEQLTTDELTLRISLDLAQLVDTGVAKLTAAERDLVDAAMHDGAHLMLLCVLNPVPTYICSLSQGADSEPVEIFRCTLSTHAMTLLTSRGQTAGH